jgi:DNA adenine methylase
MKALVKYPGGKSYLCNWIISLFPKNYENMIYVEPAVGGGSIILNKKPSTTEVINDINDNLINIYYAIKLCFNEFVNQLKFLTYDEETFKEALINSNLPFDDLIDAAVNEYTLLRISRGALKKNFAYSNRLRNNLPGDQNAWETSIDNLYNIRERLKNVEVKNRDFREILSKYTNENTFIYIDPPYMKSTRVSKDIYDHEFSERDHQDLLGLIIDSKISILISGYSSNLYNTKLKDWNRHQKIVISNSGQTKTKGFKTEILWANY